MTAAPRRLCPLLAALGALGSASIVAACDDVQTALPPVGDASGSRDIGGGTGVPPTVDGRVHHGDLHIASKADEAIYSDVAAIAGDLIITAQDASGVRLAELVEVTGSIRVVGELGAEASGNLSLPRLGRVGANLVLVDTHSIGTVDLPQLTWVGGHVDLQRGVFDLRAPRLATVNADLRFRDMRFSRLDLGGLVTVGGSLRVARYSTELGGGSLALELPSLREVGGDVELSRGAPTWLEARRLAWIAGDLDLNDLEIGVDLPSLVSVAGHVRFESLNVFSFDLESLREVGGDVVITASGGPALEELSLPGLDAVGGRVQLSGLATTTHVRLDALQDLGRRLQVDFLPRLVALHAAALPLVHSDVIVADNGQPVLIDLPNLVEIGGGFIINRNAGVDLRAALLETIVGDLRFERTQLSGVSLQALAEIGRHLVFDDVISNDGVVGLPSLTTVGGDLQLTRTTYLTSALFTVLTHVGSVSDGFPIGDLTVEANEHLATLGLDALARVERRLRVRYNPSLPEEDVLEALEAVETGDDASICDNLEGAPCE